MKHRALDLLHGSDIHTRIGVGICASIGDTDSRPTPVVLANTVTRYWYWSQPINYHE